jgi:hypothetical protein
MWGVPVVRVLHAIRYAISFRAIPRNGFDPMRGSASCKEEGALKHFVI